MDKNEDIIQLLKTYNQEHIIKLLNKLEEKQKDDLIEQINKIDFHQIAELYENTKKEIKGMLGPIFQKYNYKAKASDIQKYFNVSRVQIKNMNTGKYDEGYKLISKKI